MQATATPIITVASATIKLFSWLIKLAEITVAIAEAIKMQLHIVVDKRKISAGDGIKTIGTSVIEIKVYPEISAKINVRVDEE